MSKIKIEGNRALVEYDEVKDSVIKLSGLYFWRDDKTRIVKLPTSKGLRHFRKNSPLIVKSDSDGAYHLKIDCVQTNDGLWLVKDHQNTIKIGDTYHKKQYCVTVNGRYYVKTDPQIFKLPNGKYYLKSDLCLLDHRYYPGTAYEHKKVVLKLEDGSFIREHDSVNVVKIDGSETKLHYSEVDSRPNHPRYSKVVTGLLENMISEYLKGSTITKKRFQVKHIQKTGYTLSSNLEHFKTIEGLSYPVHKNIADTLSKQIEEVKIKIIKPIVQDIKSKLKFSDDDPTENTAQIINLSSRRYRGNDILYKPTARPINFSDTFKRTGGIQYTFGVEIETAAGLLDDKLCEELGLIKVGDGSITSAEYVTPPLHGDKGVTQLKKICTALSQHVFVDDQCAIHIHVGGAEGKNCKPIDFNSTFLTRAIRLGCAVEEDLFTTLPKVRSPFMKHCHSIQRYRGINKSNWKGYIGNYVFGSQESWDRDVYHDDYVFGSGSCSKSTVLSLYCGGRYKWLNLVNACTGTKHSTVEFRVFSATTNFTKIYNYLMFSLAFVRYVDSSLLTSKVSNLDQLIDRTITDKSLNGEMKAFIKQRKEKFKRTSIYNGTTFPTILM